MKQFPSSLFDQPYPSLDSIYHSTHKPTVITIITLLKFVNIPVHKNINRENEIGDDSDHGTLYSSDNFLVLLQRIHSQR